MKAIIDIGTNSTILLIAEKFSDDNWKTIYEQAVSTRFGFGEGEKETFETVKKFVHKCRTLNANDINIIGTAAFRTDVGKSFANRITKELKINPNIITSKEEAELALISAVNSFGKPIISVDVGGGSTDIASVDETNSKKFLSFEGLGAVRILKQFPLSDLPTTNEIELMQNNVLNFLDSKKLESIETEDFPIIFSGGTATAIASMDLELARYKTELIHGHKLNIYRIEDILENLCKTSIADRKNIAGLNKKRTDIIIPGMIIVINIMKKLHKEEMMVNHKGIRWGMLLM